MISAAPETADVYRRLYGRLTVTFGGRLDDAHAEAIALAAAELYHRQIEPELWEETPAHELLDLFGVPRAGVFSPYPLSDRIVVFRERAGQSEDVDRAHELLTALGVPRADEGGDDQPLPWRLDRLLSSKPGDEPAADAGAAGEADDGVDVDSEAGAAPLVEAVGALETAARVEAELSQATPEGAAGVDLVTMAATLNGVQVDLAALRGLIEALGVELRERLEAIHEEVLTARGVLDPPEGEITVAMAVPAPATPLGAIAEAVTAEPATAEPMTDEVPPVDPEEPEEPDTEIEPASGRHWHRRVLLVVLLTLIAFLVAAVVVAAISFGWDRVRSETISMVTDATGAAA